MRVSKQRVVVVALAISLILAGLLAALHFPQVKKALGLYETEIVSRGTLKALGIYPLTFYEENQNTTLTEINWGTIDVERTYHYKLWVYCEDAPVIVRIHWHHTAPYYFEFKGFIEISSWVQWKSGAVIIFPKGKWLHVEFSLRAIAEAPAGPFNFDIILTTM